MAGGTARRGGHRADFAMEALRKHIAWSIIRDAITRTFNGLSLDGVNVAFKGMQPEALCQPLRQAMKRRIPAGQEPRDMRLSVSLHNPLSLLTGQADVDVCCGFTVDGVAMQEAVRLTVDYHQARGLFTPLCISGVEEFVPPPADELD